MNILKIVVLTTLYCAVTLFTSCAPPSAKTVAFKVWGNCAMCKETIESSLKTDGVIDADWNKNTKIITVKYDTLKLSLDDIHKKIAGAGYDTENMKGDDQAYNNLNECCQYKRK